MDEYPRETVIRQDGPENWVGVTPFTDSCDGSAWYAFRRFDCWVAVVFAAILAASAFFTAWIVQDARWERRAEELREFELGAFGSDCWTDDDGVYHEVSKFYSSRDYGRIVRYSAKFPCELRTNLFRKVGLTAR